MNSSRLSPCRAGKPVELDLAPHAAETQDHAAAREMVEPSRPARPPASGRATASTTTIRAQPHVLGAACHVGEELHDVGHIV